MPDPLNASALLRQLLVLVTNGEYEVHDLSGQSRPNNNHGYATVCPTTGAAKLKMAALREPTHAITDADGDTIGRGLSEDHAIFDAVSRRHSWLIDRLDEIEMAVDAKRKADAKLAEILGIQ